MVPIKTFLDYLNHLEMEDKQERALKLEKMVSSRQLKRWNLGRFLRRTKVRVVLPPWQFPQLLTTEEFPELHSLCSTWQATAIMPTSNVWEAYFW
jgi:hypothetical protein